MESKLIEVKIDGEGEGSVKAVFATMEVVDKDEDVTEPGAFKKGQSVILSDYNHGSIPSFGSSGRPPVGKGFIQEVGDEALFTGKYFLDTTAGLDAYRTTKSMGDNQEWSYFYNVLKSEKGMKDGKSVRFLKALDVFEVSPVYRGAGEGTHTVSLKYAENFAAVLDSVQECLERTKARQTVRQQSDRTLSGNDRESIEKLFEMAEEMKGLLESGAIDDDLSGTAAGAFARFEIQMREAQQWQP